MTSNRPYLLRAIYDWLVDNRLTPYIMVDAEYPHASVPTEFVQDGQIVLNVAPEAIANLSMSNQSIEFDARFSGIVKHIFVPIFAVKAIYSYENGHGMVFSEDEEEGGGNPPPEGPKPPEPAGGRPKLKVVK